MTLADLYLLAKQDRYTQDKHSAYKPGDRAEWKDGTYQKRPDGRWEKVTEKNDDQKLPDWMVPKDLGAQAIEYKVKKDIGVREGKDLDEFTLKKGSKVTNIEVIAKGHGIKKIQKLIRIYKRPGGETTNATDWAKYKGIGSVVDKKGTNRVAELHWYQCKGLGKVDFKVKKWKDGK